jgi:hypothetical protein
MPSGACCSAIYARLRREDVQVAEACSGKGCIGRELQAYARHASQLKEAMAPPPPSGPVRAAGGEKEKR